MTDIRLIKETDVIDSLKAPLILLVIFIHLISFELRPISLDIVIHNPSIFISELISHNIGRCAVPLFFIFSGYLFFFRNRNYNADDYNNKIHRRIKSLLIPFLIWNALALLFYVLQIFIISKIQINLLGITESYSITESNRFNLLANLKNMWIMPIDYPLWYVQDLMGMVLISPVIYFLVKISKKGIPLFIILILYLLNIETGVKGFSSTAILFFTIGSYWGYYGSENLYKMLKYYKYVGLVFLSLCIFQLFINQTIYSEYVNRLYIPLGCLYIIGLGYHMKSNLRDSLAKLAPCTFFIYAIHMIGVRDIIVSVFNKIPISSNPYWSIVVYFVEPFIIFGVCYAIYIALRKTAPRFLGVLTGGRV